MQRPVKKSHNIVLVGFMGTGKTSIGRRISSQLRMRYVDTDDIVERDSGRRISDIFAEDGEPAFESLRAKPFVRCRTAQPRYFHRWRCRFERSQYDRVKAKRHCLLPNSNSRGDLQAGGAPDTPTVTPSS